MNKKLINAVKRNLGGDANEQLKDIAKHGIDGGFGGFIYYRDTIKFFKNNRCLKPADFETREEIARALYGKLKADDTQIPNALAWFAGEEVARYVTDGGQ